MSALVAVGPGPMVTVQDGGRFGRLSEGIPESGPMDDEALWLANTLVGNAPTEGALEFGLFGGEFTVTAPCRVAVTGGSFPIHHNGRSQNVDEAFDLRAGDTLTLRSAPDANFGYLAVAGGFALPPLLGSVATHVRYGLGPIPRALRQGDEVPLRSTGLARGPRLRATLRRPSSLSRAIRVVFGPQDDHFTPDSLRTLLFGEFPVTAKADRMGFRLAGPILSHRAGADIVSPPRPRQCRSAPGVPGHARGEQRDHARPAGAALSFRTGRPRLRPR